MILYESPRLTLQRRVMLAASSGLALAIALAVVFSMRDVLAADPATQNIEDARLETRIATTYSLTPYLRGSELSVSVQDGTATLTGIVPDGVNRELAEEIALGVEGVRDVENGIEVQSDFIPERQGTERTFGERIEDAGITTAVKSKLLWSRYTDGLSTTVETRNGRVRLEGTATSEAAKDLAGMLAQNTNGVIAVENNLTVVPASTPATAPSARESRETTSADTRTTDSDLRGATDNAGTAISDAWITTKVKTTLLYSSNVSGTAIDVETNDGVVTLRGEVNNGSEQELAVELARNVRGVKDVVAHELTF